MNPELPMRACASCGISAIDDGEDGWSTRSLDQLGLLRLTPEVLT
jgi:hypothetical protein